MTHKLLSLSATCLVAACILLGGCDGGDDPILPVVPAPTGSGYLTGKWSGSLENYHFYKWNQYNWIINHESSQIGILLVNEDWTALLSTEVLTGTIWLGDRLKVEGTNRPPLFLRISADHNTLYNDYQEFGGQLTRVVE